MEQDRTDTTEHDAERLEQGSVETPHSAPGTGGGEVTNAGEATATAQSEGGYADGEQAGPYGGAPVERGDAESG